MKNIKGRMFCDKPDVDEPKLKCGYPIPCPHHTVIMEIGDKPKNKTTKHLLNIKQILENNESNSR